MTGSLVRVLLVEDNPADVLFLETALEKDPRADYQVAAVERLSEGLEKLRQELFDVALLDLGLPDSQGFETFERFHQSALACPVVVLSGLMDEEIATRAVQFGAQDYVVKSSTGWDTLPRSIRYAIERQKMLHSLQASEQRFSSAFHGSPACQLITAFPSGRIIDANEAFCQLMGYEHDPIIGRSTINLNFWARGEDREAALQDFRTDGHIRDLEAVFQTRSGAHRTVLASVEPMELNGEQCVITTVLDITERKQAEYKLNEARELFQKTFHLSPVATTLSKLSERIVVDVNAAAERLFGYMRDELIGRSSTEFDYWVEPEERQRAYQMVLEQGRLVDYEFKFKTKSGSLGNAVLFIETLEQNGEIYFVSKFVDITERKQAEAEAVAALEFAQETIDALSAHICVLDANGTIISVNRSWRDFADANPPVPENYCNGANYLAVCDGAKGHAAENAEIVAQNIRAVLRGDAKHFQMEYECHSPSEQRWFVIRVTRFVSDGSVKIVVVHENITDRKLAEQALRENEKRYRALIENAPDGIVLVGLDGKFKYVSPSVERLFGYTQEEVPQGDPNEMTHPEDLPMVLAELAALIADPSYVPTLQYRFRHKNGEWRWIESTFSNLLAFPSVEAIIINFRDIHERKLAEEALGKSQALLTEAQRIGHIGHWEWHAPSREMACSDEFFHILEIEHQSNFLPQYKVIELLRPGEAERLFQLDKDAFAAHSNLDYEYCIFLPTGRVRWIHQIAKVDYGEDGKPCHMIGVVQDITERKQNEQALRESEERYQQFISQSFEAISRTEFDQPVDTSLPVETQIDLIYQNAYMAECNQSLAEMYGRSSPAEMVGRRLTDFHEAADDLVNRAAFREFIQNGYKSINAETVEHGADNTPIWFLNNTVGMIKDGKLVRLWGTALDITERKRNEALIYAQRDLARAIGRFTTAEEGFRVFLETILAHSGLDSGGIYLFDADQNGMHLIQHQGLGDAFVQNVSHFSADTPNVELVLAGKPYYFPASHPLIQDSMYQVEGLQTLAVVPILYQDRVIGCLKLASHTLTEVPDYARHVLETLSAEIGNFAVHLHSQEALRERTADLSRLLEAGRTLSETLDAKQIYTVIYQYVKAALPCDILLVSALNPQNAMIICEHMQNEAGVYDVSGLPPIPLDPPGQGTQSLVIRTGESMLLADYEAAVKSSHASSYFQKEAERQGDGPEEKEERSRSAILVPLKMEGKVMGVLQVFSFQLNAYTEDHLRFVETLALHASASLSNARLFAELEKRVQQRTAEVRDLYDHAPIGYHSLDENGRFVMINQTELEWLGRTSEEMVGRPFMDFVTPASVIVFQQNFPAFKKRGWVRDLEFEMIRKDGTTFPILVNATLINDESGRYFMSRSAVFDNSERKKAEQALRDSEEQNRLLFEESPDAVILLDEAGRVVRSNHAFEAISGYTAKQLIGHTLASLGMLSAAEAGQLAATVTRALQSSVDFASVELKLKRSSGEVRSVGVRMFGLKLFGRQHYLTTIRDITVEKQAAENLRFANAEMERAMRLKDEFLANMSHELRTPLNAILGISESLTEQVAGPLNDKQLRYVNTVVESGQHLLELINDILDLAKVNAGRIELDITKVNVSTVAQSSLRMIRELAQKKGLEVQIEIDQAVNLVWADERRLKQMLVNLLSNAVKFTPEGGRIGLEVRGDQRDQILTFAVWDTGIGIEQNDLRLLFQPFVQLDAGLTRGSQGTGLGLVLVSQMARLHGGSISVESEPGKGSRFTIAIPWVMGNQTEVLAPQTVAQPVQPPAAPTRSTILLVEDTEAVTMLIHDYLESHGYQVVTARDGYEGIEKTREIHPDLILMDVMMPELDGFETARRIRSELALTDVPIIALTALAMPGDRERCLAAGMNDYMSKPIRLKEFLDFIEKYLPKG
jgi:PAS domain S-box-containing protein